MACRNSDVNEKWWTSETLAVVTGANKGIGLEIVQQLAENGLTVILSARDVNRGLTATKALHEKGLHNVVFRQLDIQSPSSVSEFTRWLKDSYGGLDILVNNAAVADAKPVLICNAEQNFSDYLGMLKTPNYEEAKTCIEINYYGTKRLTETLLPLFRSSAGGARIVNVSSEGGMLKHLTNDSLVRELSEPSKITEELIDELLERLLEDIKSGEVEGKGWQPVIQAYCMSKVALNLYGRLMAPKLVNQEEGTTIWLNNVHPGRVKTEMNPLGELTAEQGAQHCVRVALLPPGAPSGQFYFMNEPQPF